MRPTLFEFAGGGPAMPALATAHHARCLADPEPAHPCTPGNLPAGHGDEGDLGRRSVDCSGRAADDARLPGAAPADRRDG